MIYRFKTQFSQTWTIKAEFYKSTSINIMQNTQDSVVDSFFQKVVGEIEFNYPPIRYGNKKLNGKSPKYLPFMQKDQDWKFGKGEIRQLNQRQRDLNQKEKVNQENQTRQIFKVYKVNSNQESMSIDFDYIFPKDQNEQFYIVSSKQKIPPIQVTINRNISKNAAQDKKNQQGKIICELFLCQEVFIQNRNYYRMIYQGLAGQIKHNVSINREIKFRGVKLQQIANKKSIFRLFISLYRENKENSKVIKDLYISKSLQIIEASRIIFIDDKASLKKYFQFFGIELMNPCRLGKQFQTINDELYNFQRQITKSGKKLINIIMLAYKFPHSCEIHVKTKKKFKDICNMKRDAENEQEFANNREILIMEYFQQIIGIFLQTEMKINEYEQNKTRKNSKLQCSKVHPNAKILFKIVHPFEKSKILIQSQFTQFFSIVVGNKTSLEGFEKIDSNCIRSFYSQYFKVLKTLHPKKGPKNKAKFTLQKNEELPESYKQYQIFEEQVQNSTIKQKNILEELKKDSEEQQLFESIKESQQDLNKKTVKQQKMPSKKKRGHRNNAEKKAIQEATQYFLKSQNSPLVTNQRRTITSNTSKRQMLRKKINQKNQLNSKQNSKEKEKLQKAAEHKKQIKKEAGKLNLFNQEKLKQKHQQIIQISASSSSQKNFQTRKKGKEHPQTLYSTKERVNSKNLQNYENEKIKQKVKIKIEESNNTSNHHHYLLYNSHLNKFPNHPEQQYLYRPQIPYYRVPSPYFVTRHQHQHCRCHKCIRNLQNVSYYSQNYHVSRQYQDEQRLKKYYIPQRAIYDHYYNPQHFYQKRNPMYPSPFYPEKKQPRAFVHDSESDSQEHRDYFYNKRKPITENTTKMVLSQSEDEDKPYYLKKIQPKKDLSRSRVYEQRAKTDYEQRRFEQHWKQKM